QMRPHGPRMVGRLSISVLTDLYFFFSSRRRHTRWPRDWSSDVCSSDLFEPDGDAVTVHRLERQGFQNEHVQGALMRSLGLSAMAAFLLRVKRKSTLLLLIVKRRLREASGLLQRLVRKQQPCPYAGCRCAAERASPLGREALGSGTGGGQGPAATKGPSRTKGGPGNRDYSICVRVWICVSSAWLYWRSIWSSVCSFLTSISNLAISTRSFCRSGAGRKGAAAGGCASACAGAGGRGVNASASARGQAGSSAAGGRGGGVMVRGAAGAGAKRLFSAIVAAPRSKEGAAAAAFGSRRAFTRLINS